MTGWISQTLVWLVTLLMEVWDKWVGVRIPITPPNIAAMTQSRARALANTHWKGHRLDVAIGVRILGGAAKLETLCFTTRAFGVSLKPFKHLVVMWCGLDSESSWVGVIAHDSLSRDPKADFGLAAELSVGKCPPKHCWLPHHLFLILSLIIHTFKYTYYMKGDKPKPKPIGIPPPYQH